MERTVAACLRRLTVFLAITSTAHWRRASRAPCNLHVLRTIRVILMQKCERNFTSPLWCALQKMVCLEKDDLLRKYSILTIPREILSQRSLRYITNMAAEMKFHQRNRGITNQSDEVFFLRSFPSFYCRLVSLFPWCMIPEEFFCSATALSKTCQSFSELYTLHEMCVFHMFNLIFLHPTF